MSECTNNCKLCKNLILSKSVTFADGVLTIDLPNINYKNCCKYCIIISQSIPEETTIYSQVVFTIDGQAQTYPFLNKDCTPIYATQLRTRRIYPTVVNTAITSGVFKYVGNKKLPCINVQSIPTLPTTPSPQS